ncbi:hypothetical protein POTOM_039904 [Populus tomentosa]|uniref:Fiber protein Fb34 n=1 Tax=Populus tomentosa TaxID=118781 RepID=A0A8X7Z443_POPTO|nr:hypothetical protein POTOM_039904 [Populus tomentosa]
MASKLLLIIVSIFDIIAFGLAVAAEQRRSTVSNSSVVFVVPGFLDGTNVRFWGFAKGVCLVFKKNEGKRKATVQPDAEKNYSYCIYDSDIATGFGVGAFLFLMASQVLIMFASKCFCCGKPLSPGGSRAWAVILFITCWVFFFIAEICLLAGSVRNAYHTRYRNIFGETLDCPSLRKGVFGAGAAFTLFTAIVSDFYYVCYSKARDSFQPYGGDAGVGMGTYK